MSHNMVTELPWELGNLVGSLTQLNVDHNPLIVPPKVVITKGTEGMLDWLAKNEKTGRKAKVSGLGLAPVDS
jgi:hypothetical protein